MAIRRANRVVLLGCGTIGQCCLPMLIERLGFSPRELTVIDAEPPGSFSAPYRAAGLHYLHCRIERDNLGRVMSETTLPGDLLLNLSVGIDSITLADWCHRHGVLYLDTAIEPWEDVVHDFSSIPPAARTEYQLHQRARRQASEGWRNDGPTAIFTHGANPGLVNHFVKAALLDLCEALGADRAPPSTREDWARLARDLGVKVIHVSERDTQSGCRPRRPGEFVNTWSIPGFVEEAMMPAEIGWGTHERRLPERADHHEAGPRNAIYIARPAAEIMLRSWVPLGGPIAGLALPHSESVTLSDYFTLQDSSGRVAYRPTVAFVYLACDLAMASLHEMRMAGWRPPAAERIMTDEIVEGRDELGVLLLGHRLGGWWYGSQLDIDEARRLVPGHNPTAIQVAAGAVAGVAWAFANPAVGFREPEQIPHDQILAFARPYLGPMVSLPTDWTPLKNRSRLFDDPYRDDADPWQFTNFLTD